MGRWEPPLMMSERRSRLALPLCRSEGGSKWWNALRGADSTQAAQVRSCPSLGFLFPGVGIRDVVSVATHLGFSMVPEEGSRSWMAPVAKWAGRARTGASGSLAGVAAEIYSTIALLGLGYVAQVQCPPRGLEDIERRAVGRVVCLPGNTLGRRWHAELAAVGGGRFGSAVAYVTACRVCNRAIWVRNRDQMTRDNHGLVTPQLRR